MYFRTKETKNNQTCFFADPSADALLREQHIKRPAIKRASFLKLDYFASL